MPSAIFEAAVVVRVISLAGSPRRPAMTAQLDGVRGLDWAFFDACRALPPGLAHDVGATRAAIRRDLTPGELGCFASHWSLWTWLAAQPATTVLLVLEDDLLIDPGFLAQLPVLAAGLGGIDYLRLHAKAPAPADVIGRIAGRHLVRYRGMAFGTQAYVLRPAAAARLAARLSRVVRPVDDAMDRYWDVGVPSLGVFPFPVLELAGASTIEASRRGLEPPRWHQPLLQARRIAEGVRRRAANLRLKMGVKL